ncbi:MAG: acyl-protein synthetase [Deltaproteobacteria bacterium]|nr:acyl-protein synthetase [Deltaproteobacteria bacterium]
MSRVAETDRLHERVRAFIDASLAGAHRETFDRLACDLARHQAEYVPGVASAFARAGVDPRALDHAAAIPALPTDVFRLRRIAAHPESEDLRVFATSGTTGSQRGRHPFRTLETYRRGALAWGARALWPDDARLRVVLLTADEERAPESSLGYMLARFADRHGGGRFFWDGERLDHDALARELDEARAGDAPVLVAGTSFAFVHLCDAVRRALPLPAGSRVMQTGGFKGRSREVEASALRRSIADLFALDERAVIAEYGMTELASQLYQGGIAALYGAPLVAGSSAADDAYHPPPWLRVEAACPTTLATLPRGEVGIARFVDLANVDSSLAVQTADRVIVAADGAVTLLGRLPGATPRGCSLALEHLLGHA